MIAPTSNRKNLMMKSLVTAIALAGIAAPAYTAPLEEIVVTAQKRSQSANDIGITVNTFIGDQLQDLGVATAEDLALVTPGLTVNETASTGVPLYSIRGVGFQDYSTSASSTVGLYFDEANMPYTVMSRGAVFDIERTEVLKGPQGDLYGRNTTAGQINFISNKPTEEFEAGVRAGYSSFQTLDIEGFVSGSLGNSIQARFAFKTTQAGEGWQKSLTRDDKLGKKDVTSLRTLFNFDFSDSANLLLRLHYVKDESDNRAPTAYNGLDAGLDSVSNAHLPLQDFTAERGNGMVPSVETLTGTPPWFSLGNSEAADWSETYTRADGTVFNLRPQRDNELKGISTKLEWDVGDATFTSITAYDDFQRVEANDWDGGAFIDSNNINTTDLQVFSQELRLGGQSGNLDWITGFYYSSDEMDEYYHYFFSDSRFANAALPSAFNIQPFLQAPILELDTRYQQKTDSTAGYAHIEWALSNQWRLTLGARYTAENRKWTGCTFSAADNSLGNFINTLFGTTLEAGDCGTINDDPNSPTRFGAVAGTANVNDALQVFTDTLRTRRLMGKVGIDFQANDDLLLYATWSQGFKSGGFNGANTNTTTQIGPYQEEVLTAYEIGSKATLIGRSMQLNTSFFYYDYKNKQEQDLAVTFVGNISGLTNIPKSRIYGAELDMQWAVSDRVNFYLGVAYLDTKVQEWQITSAMSNGVGASPIGRITEDAAGSDLPQAPKWSINSQVSFRWLNQARFYSSLAFDFNYKDNTVGVINQPENATASYLIANARITFGDQEGKWSAQLWSRNITDKYYYPSAFRGGNGPFVRVNGLPRTIGVTAEVTF